MPALIVTRPKEQAQAFADELRRRHDGPLEIILSPLLSVAFLSPDLPKAEAMIFTSANGVAAAQKLGLAMGQTAWCVGDKTALAARHAGFEAISCGGDAETLVATLRKAAPAGTLLHLRGEHTTGDIANRLRKAGIQVEEAVGYTQEAQSLTQAAIQALGGKDPVVLPLFSPRTATILARQGTITAPLHIVAISDNVMKAAQSLTAKQRHIAAEPSGEAMISKVLAFLAQGE